MKIEPVACICMFVCMYDEFMELAERAINEFGELARQTSVK